MNTNAPHGLLRVGTRTPFGIIEAVSYTAYLIAGRWVAFEKVHGAYTAAKPLIWG